MIFSVFLGFLIRKRAQLWGRQSAHAGGFNNLGLESQKYALIVTLEDPSQKIDVYNAIQNRTRMVPQTLEAYLEKVSVSSFIPINNEPLQQRT